MMNKARMIQSGLAAAAAWGLVAAVPLAARGWDEPGHVLVTELAFHALPAEIPAWVRTPEHLRRLAYLSAEPDRWRGLDAPVLDHVNGPDHYLDVEELEPYGLTLSTLPRFRRQFVEHLATQRALHPGSFPKIDPTHDKDYVQSVPGMLPYAISELRWKIASSWSTLRTFEQYRDVATADELAAARNNVIQHMGLLSHFVGDAAQPLHLTKHHHGWVGENPKGYTTDRGIHSYIDSEVIALHGIRFATLRARARPPTRFDAKNAWPQILDRLAATERKVEPLYALEKTGELKQAAGRAFLEDCLLEAGANLAGLWVAAYEASELDDFLSRRLQGRRKAAVGQPVGAGGAELRRPASAEPASPVGP